MSTEDRSSIKSFVGLLALLALLGCDHQVLLEKSTPKEEAEFSKSYLALFQARDFEGIEARIDPSLKDHELRTKLEQIAAFFPSEKPTDIKLVSAQTVSSGDLWQARLTFQYEFRGTWLLANVTLQKRGSDLVVTGVRVHPLKDSLANINRFTFEGKGASNYTIFGLAIIVPLFVVLALVLCIRTPIPNRKWLWVLFMLPGFVQITVNWTDGGININPLGVQLLGAGFWKAGPYAPVLISVSIPFGAIIFMLSRKKWLALSTPSDG